MFDSHAHLSSLEENVLEGVLERAVAAGVKRIVNIATTPLELERGMELARIFPWIVNAAATTPHDVATLGDDFAFFEKAVKEGKLVAIGETGLDYHYEHSPKELQKHFLQRYLALAKQCQLPVIFHCREAFPDLFSLVPMPNCLLHCFTGTMDEAKEALHRGWMISISGIVTFKKSVALQEVVRHVPLEHLMIETDTPYLAPQSKRGKMNEPSFILETAQCIAHLKNTSVEEVIAATSRNAENFFI